jgi:hypothetical protein
MAYFLVTYDLVKYATEEQYTDLITELKKLPSVKVQKSVWFVDWNGSAASLYDLLQAHMHQDDRLLVLQWFKNSDWKNKSLPGSGDWLKARSP